MGISTRSIPLVSCDLVLDVTEASDAKYLGEFKIDSLNGREVYFDEIIETGEMIVRFSRRTTNGDHRSCFVRGKPID